MYIAMNRFKVQNGNSIEYRYDALGRLIQILYSDPAQNVTMTYDTGAGANLLGRLASVADPSGLTEYSYDTDGNLEMETRTVNGIVFVTGYSYDAAGNLRSIVYPTGQTVDYQPDPADPATSLLEGRQVPRFVEALDAQALDGARIGILEAYFGSAPEEATAVVDRDDELAAGGIDPDATCEVDVEQLRAAVDILYDFAIRFEDLPG